jgi:hypothetical protein
MKITNFATGFILLTATLLFTGCYKAWHRVEGNMDVETEIRELPAFEKVSNEGNFDVYIIQDGLSEVEIEAESNLIPLIRTEIEGSTLVIDTKDDLRNNYPMKIYVHTDELNEIRLGGSGILEAQSIQTDDLEIDLSGSGDMWFSGTCNDVDCNLSGSGNITFENLTCDEFEADISGSGEIEVENGTANSGDLTISGSGSIRAYELLLKECHAKISGSGSIYVYVQEHLYVTISGSGSVYYLGNPIVETNISGSGSVIHP